MKLAFVGLGRMGGAMAGRLIEAGHDITVHDRDAAAVARLTAKGAHAAKDVAELCRGQTAVISMLPSDEILLSVAASLCEHLPPKAVHMVSGTHGVGAIETAAGMHDKAGQALVSCTVLGRPDRAAQGELGLITAGPASAVEHIRPALGALGNAFFDAGANPLSGVAAKIANNFVLGCAIEAMGEGMALVRRYDLDPRLFFEIMTSGLFDCVAYRSYGDLIANEDWSRVGAAATIGMKDAELAIEAAAKANVPLPSVAVWRNHLLSALGRGEENLDWAVMAREQFRRSGLE